MKRTTRIGVIAALLVTTVGVGHYVSRRIMARALAPHLGALIELRDVESIRLLLEVGAVDFDKEWERTQMSYVGWGRTVHNMLQLRYNLPLSWAAEDSNVELVRLFLAYGADPDARNRYGDTALRCAVGWETEEVEVVKALIEANADVNISMPILKAAGCGYTKTLRLLIENGAKLDVQDDQGDTPLHQAAVYRRTEAVKVLLDNGAEIDVQDRLGNTPLSRAASQRNSEVMNLLLQRGASAGSVSMNGFSVMDKYVGRDKISKTTVELLIKYGADINRPNPDGETPLIDVVRWGNCEAARVLLQAGADVNLPDRNGNTPLHWAAQNNDLKITKILLGSGASIDARNKAGDDASNLAAKHNYRPKVYDLLNKTYFERQR